MQSSAPRRIITVSFDFAGKAIHDRQLMEDKMKRDPAWEDTSVLAIAWSRKRETIELSSRITIESLPTFLGAFRPVYDMFSLFTAPYIAWRRGERPDVISISEFPLVWAAALVRLVVGGKVQLSLMTLPTEYARSWGRFHAWYYSLHQILAWPLVDEFVAINETGKAYLTRLGVLEERIRIATPDTIARDRDEIALAKRGIVRARYGIAGTAPLVLSIGRLVEDKGLSELLDVFAATEIKAKLIIVGDGVLREVLQAQARKLGIAEKVIFAGWQKRSDIWNFFADADAFVLLSKVEALGLVFWEAMYMNVPVIGRPIGGIPETIGKDGERGFLWDTKDGPDAFKDKLMRAIDKGGDVQKMVKCAREYVSSKIDPAKGAI
jgi:glycosyltransferase involved in cell wall biosynthesis